MAGAVAEVASGQSWSQLIDEIYVQPCGLETLAYNNHFAQLGGGFSYPDEFAGDPTTLRDTANPNMEGGAYVTTGDYGKLLLMHLRERGILDVLDVDYHDALAAPAGTAARIAQFLESERFENKIIRTDFHCLDGCFHLAVCRHHNHRHGRIGFPDFFLEYVIARSGLRVCERRLRL